MNASPSAPELTADEIEAYGWQIPVGGFGEAAQRRLKGEIGRAHV